MRQKVRRANQRYERYQLQSSPLAQCLTQRKLAKLLKTKKSELENLINHKEKYVIRRQIQQKNKTRRLVYPFGDLRKVHEKLKFHLNKINQPEYLKSPRIGTSQRHNAEVHRGQTQFLRIDVKQFYPSTTSEHIFRWAYYKVKMKTDVAGMFAKLATIDNQASFGSPLTPVLLSLVHRDMFDSIYRECIARGLRMTLWVDDVIISGKFVPGLLIVKLREIVQKNGLKSHNLQYRMGSRTVIVTGVGVRGDDIDAPINLHMQIHDGYRLLEETNDPIIAEKIMTNLLTKLVH